MLIQYCFNFSKFNSKSSNFHLMIYSSQIFQITIHKVSTQISCFINTCIITHILSRPFFYNNITITTTTTTTTTTITTITTTTTSTRYYYYSSSSSQQSIWYESFCSH